MLAGCTFLRLSRPCSHSAAAAVTAGKIYVPMKGEKLHKTMIGAILLQILLIFGNAVFASAEIAVISMNDAKLKRMTHDGDKRAKKLTALTEQPARFLATIQVAITLSGSLGAAFGTENFSGYLFSRGVPDPDLIIRPSGELRLSNFLLWESAYAEFYFTDVLWPDFTPEELDKAIAEFNRRDRRYGGVKNP